MEGSKIISRHDRRRCGWCFEEVQDVSTSSRKMKDSRDLDVGNIPVLEDRRLSPVMVVMSSDSKPIPQPPGTE